MTRRDRSLAGTVNETISSSPRSSKPNEDRGPGRLSRVSVAPVRPREAPADLDGGHEMCLEIGPVEADEPDERRAAHDLDRPQTPSLLSDRRVDCGGERVALRTRHRGRKVAHDLRVGVERCKWLQIGISPLPERQARRGQFSHGSIVAIARPCASGENTSRMAENEPQPVLTPLTEAAIFLVLTVNSGAEDAVREMLADVSGLVRSVGFRIPEGELSCVVGLGSGTVGSAVRRASSGWSASDARIRRREAHRGGDARRSAVSHPRAPPGPVLRARAAARRPAGRVRARGRRGARVQVVRRARPARLRRRHREPAGRGGRRRGGDR